MSNPTINPPATDRDQLRAFTTTALERFARYHDHKEAMAYAGVAAYGATAATALTSSWPPESWTWHPQLLAVIAFSALWVAFLCYLRFQLRRRRWAALRVAGCDRLLASWLPGAPKQPDDKLGPDLQSLTKIDKLLDLFWPSRKSKAAVDIDVRVYPAAIHDAWLAASQRGTEAIHHERLIHVIGWVLYFAVITRTLA